MRISSALLGILLLWPGCGLAQVTVDVVLEADQFLASAPLMTGVRITNFSGRTLRFSKDAEWLHVTVEGDNDFIVERLADPPLADDFEVPSSRMGTRWFDLQPCFNIGRPGRYLVSATVRIPELGLELTSKAKVVNITSGARVWEQEFGLPASSTGTTGAPEVRRYALIQSMNQKQVRLFVRVSDRQDAKVYRVFPIGPLLTFSHPEPQVDQEARLHVLFQTGARMFTYVIVGPDGNLLAHQTHHYTETRPRLRAQDDGTIRVTGGARIKDAADLPKPEPAPDTAPPKDAPKPEQPEKNTKSE